LEQGSGIGVRSTYLENGFEKVIVFCCVGGRSLPEIDISQFPKVISTTMTFFTSTLTSRFPTATSLYFSFALVDDSTAPPPSVLCTTFVATAILLPIYLNCLIPQQRLQRRLDLPTPIVANMPRSPGFSTLPALMVLATAEQCLLRPHSNWVETAKANGPITNTIPVSLLRLCCAWCFPILCFSSSN
jgi:hypothetical protein